MRAMLNHEPSLQIDAVDRDPLVNFEYEGGGASSVVGLGELCVKAVDKIVRVFFGVAGLLVVLVGVEHIHEDALAVDGVIERLGGAWTVGVLVCIFLVEPGFALGALLLA